MPDTRKRSVIFRQWTIKYLRRKAPTSTYLHVRLNYIIILAQ